MAGTYDLSIDLAGRDGTIALSPTWCLLVVRYRNIMTYDRSKGKSFSALDSQSVQETLEPLVITSDCIQLTVNQAKESHVSQLTGVLVPGNFDYINQILPGDWLLAWMGNDQVQMEDVIERIKQKKQANDFGDGLKFVGKVYSLRKRTNVDPNTGIPMANYLIQGAGFSELDSNIYFHPQLFRNEEEPIFLQRIGLALKDILVGKSDLATGNPTGAISIDRFIPRLVELMLGRGPNQGGSESPNLPKDTPNNAFLVPTTVGQVLGRTDSASASGNLTFADLMDLIIGVQQYTTSQNVNDTVNVFAPDNTADNLDAFKTTGIPLQGEYPIGFIKPFTNTPVWGILSNFLNPATNEMYTCLRVNGRGQVVPQLIVRQIPFSTQSFGSDAQNDTGSGVLTRETFASQQPAQAIPTTNFLDLPRWKAPVSIVLGADVGRSDAGRFNFVMIGGQSGPSLPFDEGGLLIANPPILDEQDIKRSGLRIYNKQTNAFFRNIPQFKAWTKLNADFVMGEHLALNGSFNLVGIQAPICPGDNFEFEGVVYHIQQVSHQCSIQGNGLKQFITTVQVAHGMSADPDANQSIYPGLNGEDGVTITPATTVED